MRLIPVFANAHIDFQRYIQFRCPIHQLGHLCRHIVNFTGLHFKHQFVVHPASAR